MKNILRKWITVTVLIAFSFSMIVPMSSADMGAYMSQVFSDIKASAPKSYQGQERGYYVGGTASMQFNFQDQPLVSFTPPSAKVGCGGIDIVWGGFSYLNFEYLVQKLQAILSAAPAFAFQLALGVLCPDCKNILDSLDALANMINNINVNSCQASKALVGWSGEQLGLSIGSGQGTGQNNSWLASAADAMNNVTQKYKSWINTYAGCYDYYAGYTGSRTNMDCAKKLGTVSFLVPFMRQAFNEEDLSAFPFESIMRARYGDVYQLSSEGDDSTLPPIHFDPGCNVPKSAPYLVDAMVFGQYAEKSTISDTVNANCTYVNDETQGLGYKVRQSLIRIRDAIKNGTTGGLSQADIDLINASRVPVFRLMSLAATVEHIRGKTGDASIDNLLSDSLIDTLAYPVAYDIAYFASQHALHKTRNLTSQVQAVKASMTTEVKDKIAGIPDKINAELQASEDRRKAVWEAFRDSIGDSFQKTVMMEQIIHQELARTKLLDSYRFARGMR
ncbi:MAG: conjugal transfer protein TraH [Nitrospirae bacterium]|nr:conjugal transfer protein TraH [Nitrospirota bacterium]MCL5021927.1 conjugal transfer protein TraH [Nitrospirota bacterium]